MLNLWNGWITLSKHFISYTAHHDDFIVFIDIFVLLWSLRFDVDLPEFNTKDGVHRQNDGVTITSPTLMWLKAFDLMMMHLSATVNLNEIVMVSGTAQQHGSVFWRRSAEITLSHLNSASTITDQLQVLAFFYFVRILMKAFALKVSYV